MAFNESEETTVAAVTSKLVVEWRPIDLPFSIHKYQLYIQGGLFSLVLIILFGFFLFWKIKHSFKSPRLLNAKDFARLSVKDEQGNSHWKKDRDERRKQKPVRNSNPDMEFVFDAGDTGNEDVGTVKPESVQEKTATSEQQGF